MPFTTSQNFDTVVPPVKGDTQSFLYLPLIMFQTPELSVEFPEGFADLFNATAISVNEGLVNVLHIDPLPFSTLHEFGTHLDEVLRRKNLKSLALLEGTYDTSNHISGPYQEDILYDNNIGKMEFFSTLVDNTIAMLPDATFKISKRALGGRRSRTRKNRRANRRTRRVR
jgi:hypothetical protein